MMLDLDRFESFGTTGSGNQIKFWVGDTLVKLNSRSREDEKEVSASILANILCLDHVRYEKGEYKYSGRLHKGCSCKSYLKSSIEQEITLYNILTYGKVTINRNESALSFFNKTVISVATYTGINVNTIKDWLMNILVFDYLICNTDRHLSNICIIECNGFFRLGPIFDNGQSFFNSNGELTQQEIINRCRKYKSRPFSSNPKSNLIDIKYAREIADNWYSQIIKQYGSILELPINTGHKKILNYRFDSL